MRLAIHLGVPTGPDDDDSRLLYELDAFIGSSPAFRVLSSSFFDRQVLLYQHLLSPAQRRASSGSGPTLTRWRAGSWRWRMASASRSVVGHPGLDSAEAERILLRHASAVTGTELEAVPLEA